MNRIRTHLRFLAASIVIPAVAAFAQPISSPLAAKDTVEGDKRIENWSGKTIMVFTPHPDDETFSMSGTLALLAAKQNKIVVVIYTNDNKGSKDLEMTRERLAQIRRAEEEAACKAVGIPKESIVWLGYEDGDLEYADPQRLRGEVCRLVKMHRPDAVFAPDPGVKWDQWHKTDHRMAARMTEDALLAAEWHLYYPQHLLDEGLKPFEVKMVYFYYSQEPNYEVEITGVMDKRVESACAHVSQFDPSLSKYTPEMSPMAKKQIEIGMRFLLRDGNRFVERFRRDDRGAPAF